MTSKSFCSRGFGGGFWQRMGSMSSCIIIGFCLQLSLRSIHNLGLPQHISSDSSIHVNEKNARVIDHSIPEASIPGDSRILNKPSVIDTFGIGNVPPCARKVFITLQRYGDSMQDEDGIICQGLLIRDDLILTSKQCSKSNFTFDFDFPGLGAVPAIPHNLQNLNGIEIDPRLGFLKANPPYHYKSIDQKARRNRVFLSRRSTPGIKNGTNDGTAVAMSCSRNGGRPIAHNFPVNGELVPLGHIHAAMPHILWEHLDIHSAHKLKYKSQQWYDRGITLQEEKKNMQKLLDKYNGPPGSINIATAFEDDSLKNAAGVCEAEDPRGHRKGCWLNYYTRYLQEEPFSGESFFDWLDFGKGNKILEQKRDDYIEDDEICDRATFNSNRIYFFNEMDMHQHEIDITSSNDGKKLIATYKDNGEIVPQSNNPLPHLYVQALNGNMYVVDDLWDIQKFGIIKHTSIFSGMPALAAGKMYVGSKGRIQAINYSSGHYAPGIHSLSLMYQWMKDQSFNVTALHWLGRTNWTVADCVEYDWSTIQLPGYDADSLNHSCHEATTSHMYHRKGDV